MLSDATHFFVREPFTEFFSSTQFSSYEAFVNAAGTCLKIERRTQVILVELARDSTNGKPERFVIKVYYYPLPCLGTWLRRSKAEKEFKNLQYVYSSASFRVQVAEPVAFGVKRTTFGFVRSCFIVTRYVENSFTLQDWAEDANSMIVKTEVEKAWSFCEPLGESFRSFHQDRFFLFTGKPKNILVRRNQTTVPQIVFIDIPFALHIATNFRARRAQAVDLAICLKSTERFRSEGQVALFYRAYLPDPLGGSTQGLKRRVAAAIRRRGNQTTWSSLVRRVRAAVKQWRDSRKGNSDTAAKSLTVSFAFRAMNDSSLEMVNGLLDRLL